MDNRILNEYNELKDELKNYITKEIIIEKYIYFYIKKAIFYKNWKKINDILYKYPDDILFNSPIKETNDTLLFIGLFNKKRK